MKLSIIWIIQCIQCMNLIGRIIQCEEGSDKLQINSIGSVALPSPTVDSFLLPHSDNFKNSVDSPKRYEAQIPPFWANRGRRDRSLDEEFGPFWANRGRRRNEEKVELFKRFQHLLHDFKLTKTNMQHSPDCTTRLQEPLYVEEPHWILVRRDDDHQYPARNPIKQNSQIGPYFVTRGKRCDPRFLANCANAQDGRFE